MRKSLLNCTTTITVHVVNIHKHDCASHSCLFQLSEMTWAIICESDLTFAAEIKRCASTNKGVSTNLNLGMTCQESMVLGSKK